jgi:hypothetical protein
MEICYEYLGCTKKRCVMFKIKDRIPCWEVEGTLCSHEGIEVLLKKIDKKIDACVYCIYYQSFHNEK